jgi:hypothetical protein
MQSKPGAAAPRDKRIDGNPIPSVSTPAAEVHDSEELLELTARGQKIVIYSILLNFVVRAVDQSHAVPAVAVQALFFCTAVFSLMGVVKICSGLGKTQNQKLLFLTLSFFPFINLIALVYLNVQATRMLRDGGWRVGLLGAKSP